MERCLVKRRDNFVCTLYLIHSTTDNSSYNKHVDAKFSELQEMNM